MALKKKKHLYVINSKIAVLLFKMDAYDKVVILSKDRKRIYHHIHQNTNFGINLSPVNLIIIIFLSI